MGKLVSILLIELVVYLYDLITLPVYYLVQQPWRTRQESARIRARKVDAATWESVESDAHKDIAGTNIDTLDRLFRESVANYGPRPCLGARKILAVEYRDPSAAKRGGAGGDSAAHQPLLNGSTANEQPAGNKPSKAPKVPHKYILDDKFTWCTYKQAEEIVEQLSAGLMDTSGDSLRVAPGTGAEGGAQKRLLICADTCMEWFLLAHACFRNNITVVTAYTTLDDEAILHSIHQTEVKVMAVSQKFARRLASIVRQSPLLETVIVLDEPLPGELDEIHQLRSSLMAGDSSNVKQIISYRELIARGKSIGPGQRRHREEEAPTPDDIAILMYTSGSTGKSKGVLLSHRSIVYMALSFPGPGDLSHEDRYIGYLPLGHSLELSAECIFLHNGSTIAYSSPLTLTSDSPMIKRGQLGDANLYKPTVMAAVPLVLDRIKNGIQQLVKSRGPFQDQLINEFVVNYKRYWWERCYDTPIMNWLLCRQFNMILGGEVRAICSGGAALSRATHEYLRHVANYKLLQGYGLTETSAAATCCDINERRYNVVGQPYPKLRIKLESWSDYSIDDKPHPRGEIIIGGPSVSAGYFKMDELTRESFFVDQQSGMRYFRTGDIGLMLPDGVLKIIDRKKDLVKPLSGEYISLNEIETAMKGAPVVENICVYCSPYSNYIVAIVKVEPRELKPLALKLFTEITNLGEQFRNSVLKTLAVEHGVEGAQDEQSIREHLELLGLDYLCSNKWLIERVLHLLQDAGNQRRLKRTHIPSKIKLVTDEWSPDSGLATASFKLRRREVERRYAHDIEQLYEQLGQKISQEP